jgi:hypothetical protein
MGQLLRLYGDRLLIAATALERGLTVMKGNLRHFTFNCGATFNPWQEELEATGFCPVATVINQQPLQSGRFGRLHLRDPDGREQMAQQLQLLDSHQADQGPCIGHDPIHNSAGSGGLSQPARCLAEPFAKVGSGAIHHRNPERSEDFKEAGQR